MISEVSGGSTRYYVDVNMPNVRRLMVERIGRVIMVTLYGDGNAVMFQQALPEPPLPDNEIALREALDKLEKVQEIVAPGYEEYPNG